MRCFSPQINRLRKHWISDTPVSIHTVDKPALAHAIKWMIAIALIGAGIYLSLIEFMDREWFTRSGCLIAMLGIWSALGGIIQERLLNTSIRRKQRNAIVRARAELLEKNADTNTTEAELAKINGAFDAQLSHAAEKLRLSIGLQEVSLLLTGTFIWGFGDLFCC